MTATDPLPQAAAKWAGKRYWLIGASDGLGAALARHLSRAGVQLVLSARNEKALQTLAEDLPAKAEVQVLDVTDMDSITAAHDRVGAVDGVIYLAGAYWPMGTADWDAEKSAVMADVNLGGALRCLGTIVPPMVARGHGHVVLTGSLTGFRGLPGSIGYTASKAGVMSLAECMKADLRGSGVQVQLANPGFIRTRLTAKNDFKMPQIMEPDAAAQEVFELMCSTRFAKSFPAPFAWLFRLSQFLPSGLYFRLFS
ncbi:short-chain dehydrogenase [Litorivita pollutaquae]|uniref:Short-chain dehydrogenase n=1 Tax=Litorivita pollutaquae TaxID=2200892 RepID=A0A2V4MKA2_9RHOB|nr:SDR family NAD(P)-dependent oxidoreductase [Litorivita pollutaquae]PYC47061.1 short-chain dehydrogenase [Litorivita pollutaquae]